MVQSDQLKNFYKRMCIANSMSFRYSLQTILGCKSRYQCVYTGCMDQELCKHYNELDLRQYNPALLRKSANNFYLYDAE